MDKKKSEIDFVFLTCGETFGNNSKSAELAKSLQLQIEFLKNIYRHLQFFSDIHKKYHGNNKFIFLQANEGR